MKPKRARKTLAASPQNQSQNLKKKLQGIWGETRAARWLETRSFEIISRNWVPPRGLGLGEVDLLARRSAAGHWELWLFEVKAHAWTGAAGHQEICSEAQRRRQWGSALWWKSRFPDVRVRMGLLWVDPVGGSVQFLENTCYS